jgi:hypothetical protein
MFHYLFILLVYSAVPTPLNLLCVNRQSGAGLSRVSLQAR